MKLLRRKGANEVILTLLFSLFKLNSKQLIFTEVNEQNVLFSV